MSVFKAPNKNFTPQPWGKSYVMYKNVEKSVEIGVFGVDPEKEMQLHDHKDADEFIYVLEGESKFIIENREEKLTKGSAILIPKKVNHKAINDTQNPNLCLYIVCPLESK
jgi:quercetin dioxygenase-like cupin family protein